MSEVTDVSGTVYRTGMIAGNTNETLRPIDVMDAVRAQLTVEDKAPAEPVAKKLTRFENADDTVSREELDELLDAHLHLMGRIDKFNLGSPHKI